MSDFNIVDGVILAIVIVSSLLAYSRGLVRELMSIADDVVIEGHLVVHYEHKEDQKLMVSRTGNVEIAAYHHSSRLGHSCHLSVDVIHVKGQATDVRKIVGKLQNTQNVDKVSFILAPMSFEECC